MNRADFEAVRDVPGKEIHADIRFGKRAATAPLLAAENIAIANPQGIDLRMNISFNPETGSKTFNVVVAGMGPICRLDVDGPAHRPAGRSHKHSVQGPRCPDRNLPAGIVDRPDLSGKSLRDLFDAFCAMAQIKHHGTFAAPDEKS